MTALKDEALRELLAKAEKAYAQAHLSSTREAHNTLVNAADPATISAIITELLDRRARSSLMDVAAEALTFYAEPTNYKGSFVMGGMTDHGTYELSHYIDLVRNDAGERARAVLQAISASRTGEDDV